MKRRWRMLNRMFISGKLNKKLFKKEKEFEMLIVFSLGGKIIIDISILGNKVSLNDKRFMFDFAVGDHIDKAREWVSNNDYRIDFEKNK